MADDPLDPVNQLGAIVSKEQHAKILRLIQRKARGRGSSSAAKAIAAGGGLFIEPTILGDVTPEMTVAREEVFGPVLAIITVRSLEEAVRVANDSRYGLTASVFTRDVKRAHRVARALRAGTVTVNCYGEGDVTTPFGGYKQLGAPRSTSMRWASPTRPSTPAMRGLTGTDFWQSGIHTRGAALIQPAGFVRGLAGGLRRTVELFEDSPVVRIETGREHVVHTAQGRIAAPKLILTVNGQIESFGLYRQRLMHVFTFASMTRTLTPDEQRRLGGEPAWGLIPADPLGTTVRWIPEGRIVIRNTFTYEPVTATSASKVARIGRRHDRSSRARFPMPGGVGIEYRWGGHLCLSRNSVPAFGEVEERVYTTCCQNGLGTVKGTLAGVLIADLAAGSNSPLVHDMLAQDPREALPGPRS